MEQEFNTDNSTRKASKLIMCQENKSLTREEESCLDNLVIVKD